MSSRFVFEEAFKHARILIVDDQAENVELLEQILRRAGYEKLAGVTDPREVTAKCAEFGPDLILLDIHMPHLNGIQVMEELEPTLRRETYLPILVLTGDATDSAKHEALAKGANDFLSKPLDRTEALLRIRNLLATRILYTQLRVQNVMLDQKVRTRTQKLEGAGDAILERLAEAGEYRDDETRQHTHRVGAVAAELARRLGLAPSEVEAIHRTAPLHDVGKVGIADTILLKPGKLTAEQFDEMKTHTTIGAKILSAEGVPLLEMAQVVALSHHERWDGSGYPRGLSSEQIPQMGRIVAVADVFDALTHHRPYRRAWPFDETVAEIAAQRGHQFDPDVVDAFLGLYGAGAIIDQRLRA